MVRLCLRSCSSWCHKPSLCFQHDVASALARRDERCTELQQQLPWIITLLFITYTRPIELCTGILPSAAGLCELDGRRSATGHIYRLLPCQPGHRMVHLFKLGHVHCRGSYDEHARPGGLSACSLLCRLWNHGCLLKPRHGKNGCDDQDGCGLIL